MPTVYLLAMRPQGSDPAVTACLVISAMSIDVLCMRIGSMPAQACIERPRVGLALPGSA